MVNIYLTFKFLHIIAVIAWMVGLLYLPRLFVYHCDCKKNGESDKMLQNMERRLLRFIMNPAMICTIIFGVAIIFSNKEYYQTAGWLHTKIFLVLILTGIHAFFARCRKNFVNNNNQYSQKFFRIINEVPSLILIFIIALVVFKPF
jgi:protoporphyrinogen IX oxidase